MVDPVDFDPYKDFDATREVEEAVSFNVDTQVWERALKPRRGGSLGVEDKLPEWICIVSLGGVELAKVRDDGSTPFGIIAGKIPKH